MEGGAFEIAGNARGLRAYHGTCHCGAIRFEAEVDLARAFASAIARSAGSSATRKALIPFTALRIVAGKSAMGEYKSTPSHWPPGDINHYYCPTCGAHPFSRGYLEKEMGGNFWALNVACLDNVTEEELAAGPAIYEDGKRDRQDRAPKIASYL